MFLYFAELVDFFDIAEFVRRNVRTIAGLNREATAWTIIETHEGRIWADKQIGRGVPLFENHSGICKRENPGRATLHEAWHFCFWARLRRLDDIEQCPSWRAKRRTIWTYIQITDQSML
jgi:hypothetical protein